MLVMLIKLNISQQCFYLIQDYMLQTPLKNLSENNKMSIVKSNGRSVNIQQVLKQIWV